MNAIPVDSAGHAGVPRMMSPKAAAAALVLLGSLGLAGLGVYWLAAAPADPPAAAIVSPGPAPEEAAPAPAEAEALLTAPPATCVDGRPASKDVPADACS
jgi:hypothetical protein